MRHFLGAYRAQRRDRARVARADQNVRFGSEVEERSGDVLYSLKNGHAKNIGPRFALGQSQTSTEIPLPALGSG